MNVLGLFADGWRLRRGGGLGDLPASMAGGSWFRYRRVTAAVWGVTWGTVGLIATTRLVADGPLPPFRELYELVRTQVTGAKEGDLEVAVSEALLAKVRGRILKSDETGEPVSDAPVLADQKAIENCAYVRVGQVTLALAPQLAAVLQAEEFAGVRGLVLDLRFAGGTDYRAAANAVDLFVNSETRLLAWGESQAFGTMKSNAWTKPVIVLVNRDTRGGAEAFAAALRQQHSGLVIGGRTAGVSAVFREIPLPDGSGNRLRLAVAAVKTADDLPISAAGIEPDVLVNVRPEDERAYLADPYSGTGAFALGSGTNTTGGKAVVLGSTTVRRRLSEADLVRQKQEAEAVVRGFPAEAVAGTNLSPKLLDGVGVGTSQRPAKVEVVKVIKDPVLARALDLLKGLSLLGVPRP